MGEIILFVVLIAAALTCFIAGAFQLNEKGTPLNNAYLYATEKERESMNKSPYYRQSGIIFILLGVISLINSAEVLLKTGKLIIAVLAVAALAIIYAAVSSSKIKKNN